MSENRNQAGGGWVVSTIPTANQQAVKDARAARDRAENAATRAVAAADRAEAAAADATSEPKKKGCWPWS